MSLKNFIEDKSIIIFDFDGVLVNSVVIKTNAFVFIYKEYGSGIVDKVINHHRLNGGISRYKKFEYYHNTFLNYKLNSNELDALDEKFSNYVVNKVVNCAEIVGAHDFLKKNYKEKHLFINSATPVNEINKIVDLKRWRHYFRGVYGSPNSKVENIYNILEGAEVGEDKKHNLSIFFGDARSDYIAAVETGVEFVLIDHSNPPFPGQDKIQYKLTNFLPLL